MKNPVRGKIALTALAGLLLTGCSPPSGSPPEATDDSRLRVVTSFLPLYCFAANVAGEWARVENLLPPGASPHEYPFTPRDLRKAASADLILTLGLGLDTWMEKLPEQGADSGPQRHILGLGLPDLLPNTGRSPDDSETGHDHEHHVHGDSDINPHVWLDPVLAMQITEKICDILSEYDPAHASAYRENTQGYLAKLSALHEEFQQRLEPVRNSSFACVHDAFPYLIRRYHLDQAGVLQPAPHVQPSARYLGELMGKLREAEVRVLFTERQSVSRLATRLADDLNIPTAELDTLESGPLDSDAYESGMRHNLEMLETHLR